MYFPPTFNTWKCSCFSYTGASAREWICSRRPYRFPHTHSAAITMKSLESEQRGLVGLQPRQMDYNTRLGQQQASRSVRAKHRHVPHARHSNRREMANHSSLSAKVRDQLRNIDCVCVRYISLMCCKVKNK